MERRKFLIGMGTAAAGSAAVVGSGAFSRVEATRSVSVNVVDDAGALLALDTTNADNNSYAEYQSDGQVTIDLDGDDGSAIGDGAYGVNPEARTIIFDIFKVRNQGTKDIAVWVDPDSVKDGSGNLVTETGVPIYIDPQASNRPNGNYSNPSQYRDEISLTDIYNGAQENLPDDTRYGWDDRALKPGEQFNFGLWINSSDNSFNGTISMDLKASESKIPDDWQSE